MKKFFSDFKAFALKGNIIDMAVGVVIGGAFGKIVSSLVADIISPLISLATGKVTLTDLKWVINPAVTDAAGNITQAETALTYGNFLQSIIDFLIIAFSIFVVIRLMMKSTGKDGKPNQKGKRRRKERRSTGRRKRGRNRTCDPQGNPRSDEKGIIFLL